MNENKRMLIFFISVVLIIAAILVIALWPEADTTFTCGVTADKDYKKLGSVNYKQYECLLKQDEKFAIVISDGLSKAEKKSINEAAQKTNHGIYYLSDEISNTDLKSIKKDLKTDKVSYESASIVVVEKGKVIAGLEEKLENSNDVYSFLKDSGLAQFSCNATSDSEYKNLAKLTYEQYKCLYDSEEPFILMITQSTCGYCKEFKPIMDEYAEKNKVPVYYLELDTMDQEDAQQFMSSLSYFNENSDWGTPLTLAIKNKQVVTELNGYTDDTSTIDNLFKEVGLK